MNLIKVLGILGGVVPWSSILTSIALSPWFNVYDNALSDLGNIGRNSPAAYIFNAGLIVSGVLIMFFALLLSISRRSWEFLIWTIPVFLGAADLALIGVFSEDAGRIHGIVSVIFFALIAITSVIYSYASWPLGSPRIGAVALSFGIASAFVWFVPWPWRGVAIQEAATSLMATAWLVLVSLSLPDSTARGRWIN